MSKLHTNLSTPSSSSSAAAAASAPAPASGVEGGKEITTVEKSSCFSISGIVSAIFSAIGSFFSKLDYFGWFHTKIPNEVKQLSNSAELNSSGAGAGNDIEPSSPPAYERTAPSSLDATAATGNQNPQPTPLMDQQSATVEASSSGKVVSVVNDAASEVLNTTPSNVQAAAVSASTAPVVHSQTADKGDANDVDSNASTGSPTSPVDDESIDDKHTDITSEEWVIPTQNQANAAAATPGSSSPEKSGN